MMLVLITDFDCRCVLAAGMSFLCFLQFQRQNLFDSLCNQSSHVHLSEMDPWEFDLCSSTRVKKTPEREYQLHVQVSPFLSVACLVSSAVPLTACYIDSFNPVASGPLSIKTVGHNKQKYQINEREICHQHLLHRKNIAFAIKQLVLKYDIKTGRSVSFHQVL